MGHAMQQLGVRGVLDLGACAMLSNDCCLFSAYLAVSNGIFFFSSLEETIYK